MTSTNHGSPCNATECLEDPNSHACSKQKRAYCTSNWVTPEKDPGCFPNITIKTNKCDFDESAPLGPCKSHQCTFFPNSRECLREKLTWCTANRTEALDSGCFSPQIKYENTRCDFDADDLISPCHDLKCIGATNADTQGCKEAKLDWCARKGRTKEKDPGCFVDVPHTGMSSCNILVASDSPCFSVACANAGDQSRECLDDRNKFCRKINEDGVKGTVNNLAPGKKLKDLRNKTIMAGDIYMVNCLRRNDKYPEPHEACPYITRRSRQLSHTYASGKSIPPGVTKDSCAKQEELAGTAKSPEFSHNGKALLSTFLFDAETASICAAAVKAFDTGGHKGLHVTTGNNSNGCALHHDCTENFYVAVHEGIETPSKLMFTIGTSLQMSSCYSALDIRTDLKPLDGTSAACESLFDVTVPKSPCLNIKCWDFAASKDDPDCVDVQLQYCKEETNYTGSWLKNPGCFPLIQRSVNLNSYDKRHKSNCPFAWGDYLTAANVNPCHATECFNGTTSGEKSSVPQTAEHPSRSAECQEKVSAFCANKPQETNCYHADANSYAALQFGLRGCEELFFNGAFENTLAKSVCRSPACFPKSSHLNLLDVSAATPVKHIRVTPINGSAGKIRLRGFSAPFVHSSSKSPEIQLVGPLAVQPAGVVIRGGTIMNLTIDANFEAGDVQLIELEPLSAGSLNDDVCDMPLITARHDVATTGWNVRLESDGLRKTLHLDTMAKGVAVLVLHRSSFAIRSVAYFDSRSNEVVAVSTVVSNLAPVGFHPPLKERRQSAYLPWDISSSTSESWIRFRRCSNGNVPCSRVQDPDDGEDVVVSAEITWSPWLENTHSSEGRGWIIESGGSVFLKGISCSRYPLGSPSCLSSGHEIPQIDYYLLQRSSSYSIQFYGSGGYSSSSYRSTWWAIDVQFEEPRNIGKWKMTSYYDSEKKKYKVKNAHLEVIGVKVVGSDLQVKEEKREGQSSEFSSVNTLRVRVKITQQYAQGVVYDSDKPETTELASLVSIYSVDFWDTGIDAVTKSYAHPLGISGPDEAFGFVKLQSRKPQHGPHQANDVSPIQWIDATPLQRIDLVAGEGISHIIDGFVARASEFRLVFQNLTHAAQVADIKFRKHRHDLSSLSEVLPTDVGTTRDLKEHISAINTSDIVVLAAPPSSAYGLGANALQAMSQVGATELEITSEQPWVTVGRKAETTRAQWYATSSLATKIATKTSGDTITSISDIWTTSGELCGRKRTASTNSSDLTELFLSISSKSRAFDTTLIRASTLSRFNASLQFADPTRTQFVTPCATVPDHEPSFWPLKMCQSGTVEDKVTPLCVYFKPKTQNIGYCDVLSTTNETAGTDILWSTTGEPGSYVTGTQTSTRLGGDCSSASHSWSWGSVYTDANSTKDSGGCVNGRANVAFTLATRAGAMPKNFRPVLGDLDGDGDDDLIVAGTNLAAPIAYFVNVGHGSFVPDDTAMEHVNSNLVGSDTTFGPGEQLPTLLSLRGPSFSPDLIIVDSDSGEVRVFRSRHRTYFPIEKEDNPFSKINEKEDNPFSGKLAALSFADIDDNGKMDIFVGHNNAVAPLVRYEIDSLQKFVIHTDQSILSGIEFPNDVARVVPSLVDIDGDGLIDVMASFESMNSHAHDRRYHQYLGAWKNVGSKSTPVFEAVADGDYTMSTPNGGVGKNGVCSGTARDTSSDPNMRFDECKAACLADPSSICSHVSYTSKREGILSFTHEGDLKEGTCTFFDKSTECSAITNNNVNALADTWEAVRQDKCIHGRGAKTINNTIIMGKTVPECKALCVASFLELGCVAIEYGSEGSPDGCALKSSRKIDKDSCANVQTFVLKEIDRTQTVSSTKKWVHHHKIIPRLPASFKGRPHLALGRQKSMFDVDVFVGTRDGKILWDGEARLIPLPSRFLNKDTCCTGRYRGKFVQAANVADAEANPSQKDIFFSKIYDGKKCFRDFSSAVPAVTSLSCPQEEIDSPRIILGVDKDGMFARGYVPRTKALSATHSRRYEVSQPGACSVSLSGRRHLSIQFRESLVTMTDRLCTEPIILFTGAFNNAEDHVPRIGQIQGHAHDAFPRKIVSVRVYNETVHVDSTPSMTLGLQNSSTMNNTGMWAFQDKVPVPSRQQVIGGGSEGKFVLGGKFQLGGRNMVIHKPFTLQEHVGLKAEVTIFLAATAEEPCSLIVYWDGLPVASEKLVPGADKKVTVQRPHAKSAVRVSLQVSFEGPSTSSSSWWGLCEFRLFTRKTSEGYFNLTYGGAPFPVSLRNNASAWEVSTALAKANGLKTSDYRVQRQCDVFGYCNWTVEFISGTSFKPLSMTILDRRGNNISTHLEPVVENNVGGGGKGGGSALPLFVGEKEVYVSANWAAHEEKDFILNVTDGIHMATITALTVNVALHNAGGYSNSKTIQPGPPDPIPTNGMGLFMRDDVNSTLAQIRLPTQTNGAAVNKVHFTVQSYNDPHLANGIEFHVTTFESSTAVARCAKDSGLPVYCACAPVEACRSSLFESNGDCKTTIDEKWERSSSGFKAIVRCSPALTGKEAINVKSSMGTSEATRLVADCPGGFIAIGCSVEKNPDIDHDSVQVTLDRDKNKCVLKSIAVSVTLSLSFVQARCVKLSDLNAETTFAVRNMNEQRGSQFKFLQQPEQNDIVKWHSVDLPIFFVNDAGVRARGEGAEPTPLKVNGTVENFFGRSIPFVSEIRAPEKPESYLVVVNSNGGMEIEVTETWQHREYGIPVRRYLVQMWPTIGNRAQRLTFNDLNSNVTLSWKSAITKPIRGRDSISTVQNICEDAWAGAELSVTKLSGDDPGFRIVFLQVIDGTDAKLPGIEVKTGAGSIVPLSMRTHKLFAKVNVKLGKSARFEGVMENIEHINKLPYTVSLSACSSVGCSDAAVTKVGPPSEFSIDDVDVHWSVSTDANTKEDKMKLTVKLEQGAGSKAHIDQLKLDWTQFLADRQVQQIEAIRLPTSDAPSGRVLSVDVASIGQNSTAMETQVSGNIIATRLSEWGSFCVAEVYDSDAPGYQFKGSYFEGIGGKVCRTPNVPVTQRDEPEFAVQQDVALIEPGYRDRKDVSLRFNIEFASDLTKSDNRLSEPDWKDNYGRTQIGCIRNVQNLKHPLVAGRTYTFSIMVQVFQKGDEYATVDVVPFLESSSANKNEWCFGSSSEVTSLPQNALGAGGTLDRIDKVRPLHLDAKTSPQWQLMKWTFIAPDVYSGADVLNVAFVDPARRWQIESLCKTDEDCQLPKSSTIGVFAPILTESEMSYSQMATNSDAFFLTIAVPHAGTSEVKAIETGVEGLTHRITVSTRPTLPVSIIIQSDSTTSETLEFQDIVIGEDRTNVEAAKIHLSTILFVEFAASDNDPLYWTVVVHNGTVMQSKKNPV